MLFSRTLLQTLAVVPGIHAILFGVLGGIVFGWQAAKNSENIWEKLNYVLLGFFYSLTAAIIGSELPFYFASSMAVGFSWAVLELQAKYKLQIVYFNNNNIKFSINTLLYSLIGAIPFIGFTLFDIMMVTYKWVKNRQLAFAMQVVNNN
jgi:hypothetical protein